MTYIEEKYSFFKNETQNNESFEQDYINIHLLDEIPNLNIVKKYTEKKVNVINIGNLGKKYVDGNILPSNSNSNRNNLLHFISFLV